LFSIPSIYSGLTALISSLLLLAAVQIGRAVIDNTLINWEILAIKRQGQGIVVGAGPSTYQATEHDVTNNADPLSLIGRDGKPRTGKQLPDGRVIFETVTGVKVFECLEDARSYFK
jgi:hypothetical protein